MTENDFISIAASALPEAGAFGEMLDEQVEDTGVDSLDLVILRTALEEALGREIDSHVWENAPTFRNLIEQI
ncbi:MAG: acyl carrier protein [Minwuia sp.]|nr:acyl carrier protein [Minwuia sp.]